MSKNSVKAWFPARGPIDGSEGNLRGPLQNIRLSSNEPVSLARVLLENGMPISECSDFGDLQSRVRCIHSPRNSTLARPKQCDSGY